jgi:hypothetical protein
MMGQDKKSEEKIKVIVDNGSGTRIVLDTVFYDSPRPDSLNLKDGTVVYLKHKGEGKAGHKYKVITRDSDGQSEKDEIIYINKGKDSDKEFEKTYDVTVSDNESESTIEKSRYVIARNGMVVTIEGNDDAKAKELVKLIEGNLGVTSDGSGKKETVRVESKNIIKK